MRAGNEEDVIELRGVWRTTAGVEAVWAVVSDLSCWPQWWPAMRDIRPGPTGRHGLPEHAELVFDAPNPLPHVTIPVRVVTVDPPRRVMVEADGGGFAGSGELEVVGAEHTEVHYRFGMHTTKFWLRPVDAVLSGARHAGGHERLRQAGDRLAELTGGEPGPHQP